MTSWPLASSKAATSASRLSGTGPMSCVLPANGIAIARSIAPLLAGSREGSSASAASSSPLSMMARLGRAPTQSSAFPDAMASASCAASTRVPAGSSMSPDAKSKPLRRMWSAVGPSSALSARHSRSRVAFSCNSTASAPSGSIAPVEMRTAWPGPTSPVKGCPAALSPITVHGPDRSSPPIA